jgi:hypothetical protein
MKKLLQQINQNIGNALIMASLGMVAPNFSTAAESFTNWDGLTLRLVLSQTNFVAGTPISASITVSNAAATGRIIWYSKRICDCGFGSFIIHEISSEKEVKCAIFDNDFSSSAFGLRPNQTQSFNFNLKSAYAITNPGDYSIQATARFPLYEPPNGQFTNIVTPPIIISLTNTPP